MDTTSPIIVTIHCIDCFGNAHSAFAGKNPFGPRGGRSGHVMDGECIAENLYFPEVVRIVDEYVARHPAALLVLTEIQQAWAERVRARKEAAPDNPA